jgi:hypothetical protein
VLDSVSAIRERPALYLHAGPPSVATRDFAAFLTANDSALHAAGYDLDDAAEGRAPRILVAPELTVRPKDMMDGQFYPDAYTQAVAFRERLGRGVTRLTMAVTPYEVQFRDAWRRIAAEEMIAPIAQYGRRIAGFTGGWVEVVAALRSAFDAEEVVVHADAIPPEELLSSLTGGLVLPFARRPEPEPLLTDTAVALFRRLKDQGVPLAPGQRERLMRFHARLPQPMNDPGFTILMLADLRGRYVADLATIGEMPGVRVIGAEGVASAPRRERRMMMAAE